MVAASFYLQVVSEGSHVSDFMDVPIPVALEVPILMRRGCGMCVASSAFLRQSTTRSG